VLLGGGYGALLGSTIDMGDSVHNMSLIEKVSEQLVDGEIVLIALAIFPNFSITKIEMPCRANSVMGL